MSTGVETDVSSLVNAAFNELDCTSCRKHEVPCGGAVAAYTLGHVCPVRDSCGPRCEAHYKHFLDVLLPDWRETIRVFGGIRCKHCNRVFSSVEAFCKTVPL